MRNINGKMVNCYFVCVRKLWLFSNYIEMEQESELVQIGSTIDAVAFTPIVECKSFPKTIGKSSVRVLVAP